MRYGYLAGVVPASHPLRRLGLIYLNRLPGSTLPYASTPSPDPLGYNMLMLQPLLSVGDLFTVVLVQHVLGIAMALLIYAVLVRRGAWRSLSAVAAAPVLLNGYQVYIEHHVIMSDSLFQALLVEAFAALAWNQRPGPLSIAIAGVCLGAATSGRAVGAPLLVIFLGYVLFVTPKWSFKAAGTVLVILSFAIPVAGYGLYMSTSSSNFTANTTTATSLYARAATFVRLLNAQGAGRGQTTCRSSRSGRDVVPTSTPTRRSRPSSMRKCRPA